MLHQLSENELSCVHCLPLKHEKYGDFRTIRAVEIDALAKLMFLLENTVTYKNLVSQRWDASES